MRCFPYFILNSRLTLLISISICCFVSVSKIEELCFPCIFRHGWVLFIGDLFHLFVKCFQVF